MAARTPEPRLPLEPEEYPLYKPPSRFGCSGLSIVVLVTVLVFAVLFWRITPPIVRGITSFNPISMLTGEEDSASADANGTEALTTQTPEAVAEAPPTPAVPPTPQGTCVKVSGTGGETPMRVQPRSNARSVVPLGEGAILKVVGQDVVSGKDNAGNDIVWREVQLLPPDGRRGFVLSRFLQEVPCP